MRLIIEGFETKAQMEDFWTWYSEQGEQDYATWLSCQDDTNVKYINDDINDSPRSADKNYIVKVKVVYKEK